MTDVMGAHSVHPKGAVHLAIAVVQHALKEPKLTILQNKHTKQGKRPATTIEKIRSLQTLLDKEAINYKRSIMFLAESPLPRMVCDVMEYDHVRMMKAMIDLVENNYKTFLGRANVAMNSLVIFKNKEYEVQLQQEDADG